jgi:hypothetical protein
VLNFRVEVVGDLNKMMRGEVLAGERAVKFAVGSAGNALKADWRAQVTGAGLGGRLANAVRGEVYPKGQPSLNSAALVYSKAPKIHAAHDAGPLIRSNGGFWLAIPLPAAGKGARGAKITPGQWEQKTGRRLTFIYRRGKSGLLIDTGTVTRAAPRVAFGERQRERRGFKNRTVPIFALVRQVKLPKRLSLFPAAERIASGIPATIVANWRSDT